MSSKASSNCTRPLAAAGKNDDMPSSANLLTDILAARAGTARTTVTKFLAQFFRRLRYILPLVPVFYSISVFDLSRLNGT